MKVKDEVENKNEVALKKILKRRYKKSTFKLEFKCGHQIVKLVT